MKYLTVVVTKWKFWKKKRKNRAANQPFTQLVTDWKSNCGSDKLEENVDTRTPWDKDCCWCIVCAAKSHFFAWCRSHIGYLIHIIHKSETKKLRGSGDTQLTGSWAAFPDRWPTACPTLPSRAQNRFWTSTCQGGSEPLDTLPRWLTTEDGHQNHLAKGTFVRFLHSKEWRNLFSPLSQTECLGPHWSYMLTT